MSRMSKITDYEIIDHGIEHSDYFQGCGTCFTAFNEVVTGIGNNPIEALDDCLEQIGWNYDIDEESFSQFDKYFKDSDKVENVDLGEGQFYHVSIRFNLEEL